jgi:hypothetical protein
MDSAHDFQPFPGADPVAPERPLPRASTSDELGVLAPSAMGALPPTVPTFRERIRSFTMEDWRAAVAGEDPTAARKRSPDVIVRRARNLRVVKIVVAVCAALCLVALVRIATAADPTREAPVGPTANESDVGRSAKSHLAKAAPVMKHDEVTRETARSDARAEGGRPYRPRRR